MASAEPGRKSPYSNDLRWRIVYQKLGKNYSYRKIANNLNISISTVYRVFNRFIQTDSINCNNRPTRIESMRKLSRNDELYVIGIVFDNPTMYIDEICHEVFDATGITVSASTICRLLKAYGITRKKVQFVAIQRSATLRGAFMAHCHMFSTDKFIWVDETGTDRRPVT